MQITPTLIKELLNRRPGSKPVRENNLWIEIGTGKTRKLHFRFYWVRAGVQYYHKIGQLTANSPLSEIKRISDAYLQLYDSYIQGITPDSLEADDRQKKVQKADRVNPWDTIEEDYAHLPTKAHTDYHRFGNLNPLERSIVFYAENRADWDHFRPLVQELVNNENLRVCYITSDHKDPVLNSNYSGLHSFFIGYGSTRRLFFEHLDARVIIMTMPDLARFNLRKSGYPVHYIFVFDTAISTHMGFMRGAFDHYDAIFCTGPHQIAELHAAEQIYDMPTKALVEYGSPLIDQIIDQIDTTEVENDRSDASLRVLIAPTYGPQNLIEVDDGQLCIG